MSAHATRAIDAEGAEINLASPNWLIPQSNNSPRKAEICISQSITDSDIKISSLETMRHQPPTSPPSALRATALAAAVLHEPAAKPGLGRIAEVHHEMVEDQVAMPASGCGRPVADLTHIGAVPVIAGKAACPPVL
jgi:hypothetical protein